jgi:hypothetical protein
MTITSVHIVVSVITLLLSLRSQVMDGAKGEEATGGGEEAETAVPKGRKGGKKVRMWLKLVVRVGV